MEWFLVLSLLLVGLLLIIAEVIFIPGTTLVGILGLIFSIMGIYNAYGTFGKGTGSIILASFIFITGIAFYVSLKGNIWLKFALKDQHTTRANEGLLLNLMPGMVGKAVSALRPNGTAEFANQYFEVHSQEGYLDRGTEVRIHKIENNTVFVESIKS